MNDDSLVSAGELEDDMQGMVLVGCGIKIVYPDMTLKQVKSTQLKQLDQIINYNAEKQMKKNRSDIARKDPEYHEWQVNWLANREKVLKKYHTSRNQSWINFKRHYANFKEALFGPDKK